MHRLRSAPALLAVLLGLALATTPAEAQRLTQYARASVEAPSLLARGGAGVALPSGSTALFYNPAQLARLELRHPRVEVLGLQGSTSPRFFGDIRFMLDDVRPAVEAGFSSPRTPEEDALLDEAILRGRRPTVTRGAVTLPSVMVRSGNVGFGGGVFLNSVTRHQVEDLGAGVPLLDFFSQADAIGVLSGAVAIGDTPLALGATGRYIRRGIAYKRKDILRMDASGEELPIISGSTFALDIGLHAADLLPALPGRLDLGLAVYDLLGGGFTYALDHRILLTGTASDAAADAEAEQVLSAFADRDGHPAFRAGAAYHFSDVVGFTDVALALDYVSTGTSESRQPPLSKLRFGVEARIEDGFALRTGLSQGYPSLGLGTRLGPVRLDYVLYGEEDGRLPGQLGRYAHLLQLRFGWF